MICEWNPYSGPLLARDVFWRYYVILTKIVFLNEDIPFLNIFRIQLHLSSLPMHLLRSLTTLGLRTHKVKIQAWLTCYRSPVPWFVFDLEYDTPICNSYIRCEFGEYSLCHREVLQQQQWTDSVMDYRNAQIQKPLRRIRVGSAYVPITMKPSHLTYAFSSPLK